MTIPLHPPATLAAMRALNEANLPDLCAVYDAVETRLPGGVVTREPSPTPTQTGLRCRLSPAGDPAEVVAAGQEIGRQSWILVLPAGTTISREARVVVTAGDGSWTRTLEVVGARSPRSYETQARYVCIALED